MSIIKFWEIILIAFALSADAFAVSLSIGRSVKNYSKKLSTKVGFLFGGFQALMPFIGYVLGNGFKSYIEAFDHFVILGILVFIGVKMLYEALTKNDDNKKNYLNNKVLLLLAVATSIDAFAVGLTLSFLGLPLLLSIIIIGLITFLLSFLGVYLGNKSSKILGIKFEIIGGLILISIGVKIFIEHLLV